jgi:hypothetical protein
MKSENQEVPNGSAGLFIFTLAAFWVLLYHSGLFG